jgi:tetratricopeptide (TPR) repeat protein
MAGCAGSGVSRSQERGQALSEEADAHYQRGEYSRAVEKYTQSIEAFPESPDAFYRRGRARLRLIDVDPGSPYLELTEQALQDFEIAIRLFPEFFEAYYARAVAYASVARYKEAAFDLVHYCLKIRPQDREAALLLAKVYDKGFDGKEAEALKYYEKYIQLGGTDLEARQRYDQLKGNIASTKKADDDEKKASDLFNASMQAEASGRRDEALKGLSELLAKFAHTQFVKDRESIVARLIERLSPEREKK